MSLFVNELINDEDAMVIHLGKNHDGEMASTLFDVQGKPIGRTCWRCETFVKLQYPVEVFFIGSVAND